MRWSRGPYTGLLVFTLGLTTTSENFRYETIWLWLRPVIASNGVPYLQTRTLGLHSTSVMYIIHDNLIVLYLLLAQLDDYRCLRFMKWILSVGRRTSGCSCIRGCSSENVAATCGCFSPLHCACPQPTQCYILITCEVIYMNLTNFMAYGTRRLNAAFTRALQ
jgi:hypothetical protein